MLHYVILEVWQSVVTIPNKLYFSLLQIATERQSVKTTSDIIANFDIIETMKKCVAFGGAVFTSLARRSLFFTSENA